MPSPGAAFLLSSLPGVVIPVLGLKACFYVLRANLGIVPPPLLTWFAYVSVNPMLFFLRVILTNWRHKHDAARMGAVQVPVIRGQLPGNYDVVKHLSHMWDNGYVAEAFWPIVRSLGNIFCIRFVWVDQLFTIEPSHIKQILATEFNNFEKGTHFTAAAHSVLGVGVFNSDGEMWKFHRNMTRPFFSRERISHFDIFARHADATLALASQRFQRGYGVDVQDLFARFTLDSATDFLFGRCVNSLHEELPYPRDSKDASVQNGMVNRGMAGRFSKAFLEAQLYMEKRTRRGVMWPLWEVKCDKTKEPMAVVDEFLNPILADIFRQKEADRANNPITSKVPADEGEDIGENETLVDHLVNLTNDMTIIKDETINILLAGRDTIAATLTFATYSLAMYPDVLQCLRAEIMEYVGPTRRPSYDDIREMKYLRAVINETLRLYPPVPYDVRQSIKSTMFPNPTPGGKPWYVPPRTNVTYSVFMMHRRTDLWGPDAMEFDPRRFLDDRVQKYLTPNPFIFLPFNAGPRICLGQQFAYNEVSLMLVRLLQTFDEIKLDEEAQPSETRPPAEWKNVPGRQSIERFFPKTHLTMYAHGGLWARMREAKE